MLVEGLSADQIDKDKGEGSYTPCLMDRLERDVKLVKP
jgi:hypothetical protein